MKMKLLGESWQVGLGRRKHVDQVLVQEGTLAFEVPQMEAPLGASARTGPNH